MGGTRAKLSRRKTSHRLRLALCSQLDSGSTPRGNGRGRPRVYFGTKNKLLFQMVLENPRSTAWCVPRSCFLESGAELTTRKSNFPQVARSSVLLGPALGTSGS